MKRYIWLIHEGSKLYYCWEWVLCMCGYWQDDPRNGHRGIKGQDTTEEWHDTGTPALPDTTTHYNATEINSVTIGLGLEKRTMEQNRGAPKDSYINKQLI